MIKSDYQSVKLILYPEIQFKITKIYQKLLDEFEPNVFRRIQNRVQSIFTAHQTNEESKNNPEAKHFSFYGYLYIPSRGKIGTQSTIKFKLKPSPKNTLIPDIAFKVGSSSQNKLNESLRETAEETESENEPPAFQVIKLKKNYLEAKLYSSGIRILGERLQKFLFDSPLMEFKWNCILSIPGNHAIILEILWNDGQEEKKIAEVKKEVVVFQ